MLKTTKVDLLVFILVMLVMGLLLAKTGDCAFCSSMTCYASAYCGESCVCLIPSGELHGSCVSIE